MKYLDINNRSSILTAEYEVQNEIYVLQNVLKLLDSLSISAVEICIIVCIDDVGQSKEKNVCI